MGFKKVISVVLKGNGNATKSGVQSTQMTKFNADVMEMIPTVLW